MRIAVFQTDTILSSWSNLAIPDCLRSMGHEVIGARLPGSLGNISISRREFARITATMPTIEQLQACDVVLVIAPEFLNLWLREVYGAAAWRGLKAAKANCYVESSRREDCHIDFAPFQEWADVHFYPDKDDAERLKGKHLRACVDTAMFCPGQTDKRYDVAFVGSMYQKRVEYARNLLARLDGRIDFRCGSVTVRDLSGECQKLWAELLADNLRQIRVHLCLPSANSRMMVARPLETMACGTFCLTYRTPDHPFTSEQCATYDPAAIDSLIDQLRYYLDHEEERERIAAAGCREVHAHWSLPERMREVLSAMTE